MIRTAHLWRLIVLAVLFALLAGALGTRLVCLQWQQHEFYSRVARTNLLQVLTRESRRGDILDARAEKIRKSIAEAETLREEAERTTRQRRPDLWRRYRRTTRRDND